MNREMLPIADFQKRLADNFSYRGVVGGHLSQLFDIEEAAGNAFVSKYIGHQHLSDSWQSFFFQTLMHIDNSKVNDLNKKFDSFAFILLEYIMILRRIRSASGLSGKGYLGSAYALLRDIKDRAIHLSALFQGMVTYSDLMGISTEDPPKATPKELANIRRKRRIKTERMLLDSFIGNSSGLSQDDIDELSLWADLFDREMHGSFLSTTTAALDWLRDGKPPKFVSFDEESMDALYVNRFCEVAWMVHRLLPILQSGTAQFSDRWASHWHILDVSFWQMQMGMTEIGKKIGQVMIRYIDAKFPFDPSFRA